MFHELLSFLLLNIETKYRKSKLDSGSHGSNLVLAQFTGKKERAPFKLQVKERWSDTIHSRSNNDTGKKVLENQVSRSLRKKTIIKTDPIDRTSS